MIPRSTVIFAQTTRRAHFCSSPRALCLGKITCALKWNFYVLWFTLSSWKPIAINCFAALAFLVYTAVCYTHDHQKSFDIDKSLDVWEGYNFIYTIEWQVIVKKKVCWCLIWPLILRVSRMTLNFISFWLLFLTHHIIYFLSIDKNLCYPKIIMFHRFMYFLHCGPQVRVQNLRLVEKCIYLYVLDPRTSHCQSTEL